MAKYSMSIRVPDGDKRFLDALVYITGEQQVDVLMAGMRLYFDSLPIDVREKILQAEEIKKTE